MALSGGPFPIKRRNEYKSPISSIYDNNEPNGSPELKVVATAEIERDIRPVLDSDCSFVRADRRAKRQRRKVSLFLMVKE